MLSLLHLYDIICFNILYTEGLFLDGSHGEPMPEILYQDFDVLLFEDGNGLMSQSRWKNFMHSWHELLNYELDAYILMTVENLSRVDVLNL